jgi:hypothetical protein
MLCGRVYSDELERLVAFRDELMLCASWYDDDIASLDFLVFARNGCEAAAGCEEEDLVDGVDLMYISKIRKRVLSCHIPHHQCLHPQAPPSLRLASTSPYAVRSGSRRSSSAHSTGRGSAPSHALVAHPCCFRLSCRRPFWLIPTLARLFGSFGKWAMRMFD